VDSHLTEHEGIEYNRGSQYVPWSLVVSKKTFVLWTIIDAKLQDTVSGEIQDQ
jgi:hypothetical protein